MAIWRKSLQFMNVMLANRSPISVTERGPGRMTYAKKNPLQNTTCASRFSAQVKRLIHAARIVFCIPGNIEIKRLLFTIHPKYPEISVGM